MTIDHFRDFSRKIVSYLTNEIVRNGKNTQRINENHIGFYAKKFIENRNNF